MSTSISFAISTPDHDAQASKSFSDLRFTNNDYLIPQDDALLRVQNSNCNQPYERRHTGSDAEAGRAFFELGSSKLKRWRYHTNHQLESPTESRSVKFTEDIMIGEDYYEEVDERMSRNSLEYPEHQAKYIERWLNEMNSIKSKSFDVGTPDEGSIGVIKGNVIGIRGFSSENSIIASHRWRDEFKRLKCEYIKLQLDHSKLKAQFDEANQKYRKVFKKKENDVGMLKALVRRQSRRSAVDSINACEVCSKQLLNQGKQQSTQRLSTTKTELPGNVDFEQQLKVRKLEFELQSKDMEHETMIKNLGKEIETLKNNVDCKNVELNNLRNQVKNLLLEPRNRQFLNICNENLRLKDLNEMEIVEFQFLKENYAKLESQLKSISNDQKSIIDEKDAELRAVMIELCRLQVYQPKLEMILNTERQIKSELQSRIESLQQENVHLNDSLNTAKQEIHKEKYRAKGIESNEIDRLQEEISRWQDKCHRLAKEKSDYEDLLRNSRAKFSSADAMFQNEINQIRETRQIESDRTNESIKKLEIENKSLVLKVDEFSSALKHSEMDRQKLIDELMTIQNQLESSATEKRDEQQLLSKLKEVEDKTESLKIQLQASESRSMQLVNELEDSRSRLEHSTQQLSDLRRRFDLQLKSFEELKERKDKELARLRVDLNFEQYNRQVALKGIERELRASLKELETMKCRFTSRLSTQCDVTSGRKKK